MPGRLRNLTNFKHSCSIRSFSAHLSYKPSTNSITASHRIAASAYDQRRNIGTLGAISPLIAIPSVFIGLQLSVWTFKCLMLIVFQDKVIYVPGLPPGARDETIESYKSKCHGVEWLKITIKTNDGKQLAGCIAESSPLASHKKRIIVLYFQGNGSSIPPRLPFMSPVIAELSTKCPGTQFTFVMVSYRGYWSSSGKPRGQKSLELDASAAMRWVNTHLASKDTPTEVVLWGQSVGAGVATTLLANQVSVDGQAMVSGDNLTNNTLPLTGLILETPFTSIADMLHSMYPQKWLPYRYLTPFLRSWWDIPKALDRITSAADTTDPRTHCPKVLLLTAGRDELVPKELSAIIKDKLESNGFELHHTNVPGALHVECLSQRLGGGLGVRRVVEWMMRL